MEKKKKLRKYTVEEKIKGVRLLKENGYDYKSTSREIGVPSGTLYQWNNKYGIEIESGIAQTIAVETEKTLSQYKSNFLKVHYNRLSKATELAIDRATELLKDEEDLTKVNGTIKVLSEMISKLTTLQGNGENNTGTTNIIRQSIIQLNQMMKK